MTESTKALKTPDLQSQCAVEYLAGPQRERTRSAVIRFLRQHPGVSHPGVSQYPPHPYELAQWNVSGLAQDLAQILLKARGHCDFTYELTRPVFGGLDWETVARNILGRVVSDTIRGDSSTNL